MKTTKSFIILLLMLPAWLWAQDKEAVLSLKFDGADSIKKVLVTVTSDGTPAKEVEVKLFAERLGGQLPLGEGTTDEEGLASFDFPADLPGDEARNIKVVAKVEDNDVFMDTEVKGTINWGVEGLIRPSQTLERSLSAGRARAPIYFIVIANLIIIGIWGTLGYIVLQMFKLKKLGTVSDENHL